MTDIRILTTTPTRTFSDKETFCISCIDPISCGFLGLCGKPQEEIVITETQKKAFMTRIKTQRLLNLNESKNQ